MTWLAPAVIVHSAADARIALAPGLPITLVSAPGAALYAGAGWWIGLIAAARADNPARQFDDVLDCGDAPGAAAEALRAGQRRLVLDPSLPALYERVRLMAEALGATLLPEMPEALDLAVPGAARRLSDWIGATGLVRLARRRVTMKTAFASPRRAMHSRLYLVTPPRLDPSSFRDRLAAALDAGDIGAVQLRLKDVDDDAIRRAIDVLRPVAQSRDVAFLLNDRPDIACATGCDGAHVGQEDQSVRDARRILGPDLTLGVSCHGSRELAMNGGEDGADYVAFGAFFPTGTKADAPVEGEPDILAWWSEVMELPCVAIGGITPANCAPLVQAGVDFLAVVSAVWDHPDGPGAGVRAMNAAIAAA